MGRTSACVSEERAYELANRRYAEFVQLYELGSLVERHGADQLKGFYETCVLGGDA